MEIPLDILKIISSYLVKPTMKLLDWIDINKLDMRELSRNYEGMKLLEQNIDKIDWKWLSYNSNAIHLLLAHPEKIDWKWLSGNCNAMHILEQNMDKIDWEILSCNPSIFEIDKYKYNKDILDKSRVLDSII